MHPPESKPDVAVSLEAYFHHAVVRPLATGLTSRGGPAAVWARGQGTFLSKVVGPHFERLCREWVSEHADPGTFGLGFTPDLRAAAARGDVVLVDLERLYGGA